MNKLIAIGDIHGEYFKLKNLIEKLKPHKSDTVIFLGDYIDRGLYSKRVIDYLLECENSFNCIFLMGNHEYYFLKSNNDEYAKDFFLTYGGIQTIDSYYGYENILKTHKNFFDKLKPYYLTEEFLFVHAGIRPDKILEEQEEIDFYIIRNNFINYKHKLKQKVIFGHTPFEKPFVEDDKIGIDTGCGKYSDGYLTAYICNENKFVLSN